MVAVWAATIHPEEAGLMAQQMSIRGIAIAQLGFHVGGMDDTGHMVRRKRLAAWWLPVFAGIAITRRIMASHFTSDWLRDRFDPTRRQL
jgi:ABC-type dipeptide/oligopeptide/nickel transport system permease subunit